MDNLDRLIAQLKAENKKLNQQLQSVRMAVSALEGASYNGNRRGRLSASARRRIAAAQKKRWAKWHLANKRAA
jgi:hypothetical protein